MERRTLGAFATRLFIATAGLVASGAACKPPVAPPVRVAAAADLGPAFEELGRAFARETGHGVTFSFGSTGLLARQLREGAPFDVFAAANQRFVDELVAGAVCDGATRRRYARGRVVVWSRRGRVAPPASLSELTDGRFARIAIANPEHAPYGLAARQALERAGVWPAIAARVVLGENVRQALQLAQTGNVEAALVALALVAQDREHPFLLVDEALHEPIEQVLAVCARGGNRTGGEAFARFVVGPEGRAILRRHGLLPPGETLVRAP